MKKYTYKNWLSGKFSLIYGAKLFKKNDDVVHGVKWEDFNEIDVLKIKEKQKELFEQWKNELVEKWEKSFLQAFENSEMKNDFLLGEIKNCETVFSIPAPKGFFEISFLHGDSVFTRNYLSEVQAYFHEVIKKGNPKNYDFINSPNYPHQNKSKIPPQIYAQARWEFYKWLKSFNVTKKISNVNEEKFYSQKQIAIAYFFLGITINENNFKEMLKKHSVTRSSKILQKLITKNSQITSLTKNKTVDSKHLKDLVAAKRLIVSKKNKEALEKIDQIITTFNNDFDSHYEKL